MFSYEINALLALCDHPDCDAIITTEPLKEASLEGVVEALSQEGWVFALGLSPIRQRRPQFQMIYAFCPDHKGHAALVR